MARPRRDSHEVTSEGLGSSAESVFAPGQTTGWRAAVAGEQTIRVIFEGVSTIELSINPDIQIAMPRQPC
jgi:hypothetical protein